MEKIDRTRGHAAHLFATLVTSKVNYIPHKDQVLECFPEKIRQSGPDFDEFGWSVESETFPIFAKLLRLPAYAEAALLGLIVRNELILRHKAILLKLFPIMKVIKSIFNKFDVAIIKCTYTIFKKLLYWLVLGAGRAHFMIREN